MLKVKLILENGEEDHFYLSNADVQKLDYEVEQQNVFNRENNNPKNYTMADALRFGMYEYLKKLGDLYKAE